MTARESQCKRIVQSYRNESTAWQEHLKGNDPNLSGYRRTKSTRDAVLRNSSEEEIEQAAKRWLDYR